MAKLQPNFSEVFKYPNFIFAAEECCKNVMWKQSVQMFSINMYMWCSNLYYQVNNHKYRTRGFTEFYICERGKVRFIQSVHISERCVQKVLTEYGLKPIITPSLIYDNAASLKGKGNDFAIKRFREHLRWHYARYGLNGGILIGDFHDYFHSIDHEILFEMLDKKIYDKDLLNFTKYFIEQFGDKGLGLGSEVSQICAIFYPNKLDHMIKEKFGIHGYGRYMDDFYIICEDIKKLKLIFESVKQIVSELKLTLNEKHTQIYEFKKHPVFTYLKCRTSLTDSGKIVMRMVKKNCQTKKHLIKKQRRMVDDNIIDFNYVEQSMNTWLSYARKRKQSYNSTKSVIKMYHIYFRREIMYEKENNKLRKQLLASAQRQEDILKNINRKIDILYRNDYKEKLVLNEIGYITGVLKRPKNSREAIPESIRLKQKEANKLVAKESIKNITDRKENKP